jgi:HD-like signal output (HDOD) protein
MIEAAIVLGALALIVAFGVLWLYRRAESGGPAPTSEVEDEVPEVLLPQSVSPEPQPKARSTREAEIADSVEARKHSPEILVNISANYHTIEDISDETLELLGTLNQALPKLPNATLDLLPVLAKPGTGAKEVAKIIERDQATAARLLRWVNSSFYGLEGKVSSLQRAITVLGMETVRSVVLEDAFSRGVKFKGLPGVSPHTIWRHAAASSVAAKHIARQTRGVEPDVAATAGLLHDIGILLMLVLERQNLKDIVEIARQFREPLIENEFDFLGFNHQVWGESFVKDWNLPTEIAEAIGRHHCPMKEPFSPLAAVLWLANYMVSRMGFACPQDQVPFVPDNDLEGLLKDLGLRMPVEHYITEGMIREIVNATSSWSARETTPEEAVSLVEAELGTH